MAMSRDYSSVVADLAKNLHHYRVCKNLSQEALALSADVDRTYVSQIERGISNPSIAVVCKLAQSLDVEIEDLLSPTS